MTGTRLCIHPGVKIGTGIFDPLTDSVPAGTITSAAPRRQRFSLYSKETCHPGGIKQQI
jgi:hypothetical protein